MPNNMMDEMEGLDTAGYLTRPPPLRRRLPWLAVRKRKQKSKKV
jgi:hypothetical protein